MRIKTILFDVGGVLIVPLDEVAIQARREQLAQELGFGSGRSMWLHLYRSDAWELAKRGHLTRQQMMASLLAPLGLTSLEQQQAFVQQLYEGEGVQPEMRQLVRQLSSRYQLGVLSNYDDTLERQLETFGLTPYFDQIINSYRVGAAKPEPKVFAIALDRLQARPGEVYFIDNLMRNIEAAAALGFHTHHFTDIPTLIQDMEEQQLL